MKIIQSRPPNFDKIVKVFYGAERPGVIFAYAPNIYSPRDVNAPPDLVAHEMIHIERQEKIGVDVWWDRYLADPEFRFNEELLAHRAELAHLLKHSANRNTRRMALKHVAKKLSASLYGRMVTREQAIQLLTDEQEIV